MADITKSNEQIAAWDKNLEKLKNGEFGAYKLPGESEKALLRYWRAQAEAGYPSADENVRYFEQLVGGIELGEQFDEMALAVLSCYRNKYSSEGISTEQGVVAGAINEVLPVLVALKNGDYRKESEVAKEITKSIIDGINELLRGCTFKQSACYLRVLSIVQDIYEKYKEGE